MEAEILPTIGELGIGFVAYSPLGRGFLTATVKPAAEYPADDMRSWDDRWQPATMSATSRRSISSPSRPGQRTSA